MDVGKVKEGFNFVAGEAFFGETMFTAGELKVGGGIGGKVVVTAEVGEEVLHRSEAVFLGFDGERLTVFFALVVEVSLVGLEDFFGDLCGLVEVAEVGPFEEVKEAALASGDGPGFVVSDVEMLEPEVAAGGEVLVLGGLDGFGASLAFAGSNLLGWEVAPVGVVLESFFSGHIRLCLLSTMNKFFVPDVRFEGKPQGGLS